MFYNRNSKRCKIIKSCTLFGHKFLAHYICVLNVKHEHMQPPLFYNRRILCPQSSCCKISWVCREFCPHLFLFFIIPFKVRMCHINLSTELHVSFNRNLFLYVRNHERRSSYVSTNKTVSSRLAQDKFSILIPISLRKSIYLTFYGKCSIRMNFMNFPDPIPYLIKGENIVNTQHWYPMRYICAKVIFGRSTNFLSRRIRRYPFGM